MQEPLSFWEKIFLAISRALIDMESGELMLRVHDKCLVFNVYKPMHQPSDTKSCMKIGSSELPNQKPPDKPLQVPPLCMPVNKEITEEHKSSPDKVHKKKNKGAQGQKSYADKLSQSHQSESWCLFASAIFIFVATPPKTASKMNRALKKTRDVSWFSRLISALVEEQRKQGRVVLVQFVMVWILV
ncbi:hypothetical protein PIB30_066574 [Stylosanthes scabra]|uniref:Uncharacterized protein n=1 Tax=Stylosanthes scabra TaxID=79078 RepID=A0ABU6TM53_9FABA|nr:hypothetical protein [Stylosanthes scabra]